MHKHLESVYQTDHRIIRTHFLKTSKGFPHQKQEQVRVTVGKMLRTVSQHREEQGNRSEITAVSLREIDC